MIGVHSGIMRGLERKILITGGAGFIGCNLAERFLSEPGNQVCVFDDLSRTGVEHNLKWLKNLQGSSRLEFIQGDVRSSSDLRSAAAHVTEIYHLAAQVAVTSSVDHPRRDFETNALGTFNVLEAARHSGHRPFVLFTSTNKVYGSLHGVPVSRGSSRYTAANPTFRGVSEDESLDFHSPYGCSKGAADQYVRDYSRIYDLPTVVFRMSCIAGPHQFGNEDQGWVAHFLYSVLERKPITIYGDGLQVRDILHVSDLVDAIEAAYAHAPRAAGEIYNLGGGPERSVSVSEMLASIAEQTGIAPILQYSDTRPGDQPLYISDTSKLTRHTGWQPRYSVTATLQSIQSFWNENRTLLAQQRGALLSSKATETLTAQLVR